MGQDFSTSRSLPWRPVLASRSSETSPEVVLLSKFYDPPVQISSTGHRPVHGTVPSLGLALSKAQ